jgi:hypothetical protein
MKFEMMDFGGAKKILGLVSTRMTEAVVSVPVFIGNVRYSDYAGDLDKRRFLTEVVCFHSSGDLGSDGLCH